jgi:hypothetical protein
LAPRKPEEWICHKVTERTEVGKKKREDREKYEGKGVVEGDART